MIFCIQFLAGCSNDFVPEGLYDYQAARLLSADDQKLWTVTRLLSNGDDLSMEFCQDSLFILFESEGDSLIVNELRRDCSVANDFDTLLVGTCAPSQIGLLFSDSLLYADGRFWIISDMSADMTRVHLESLGNSFRYDLKSYSTE